VTLVDRAQQVTTLAVQTAATAQASANAATLTSTLGAIQDAEADLVEMAGLLTALRDEIAHARAHEESEVARERITAFAKRRPADGHWQHVVLESPDDVNELVRAVREAAVHFQREAITSWQRVSDEALRRGGGSVAALEALGGKFKQRAGQAKRAREELVQSVVQVGTRTPTSDEAASVLEKSEQASRAFDEALSLIPDERVRDGLARAISSHGLPLRESKTLLAWIKNEGLENSFSVRLSEGQ
jgi:hypothetical protein